MVEQVAEQSRSWRGSRWCYRDRRLCRSLRCVGGTVSPSVRGRCKGRCWSWRGLWRRRTWRRRLDVFWGLDLAYDNGKLLRDSERLHEKPNAMILTASWTKRMHAKPAGANTAIDVLSSARIASVTC